MRNICLSPIVLQLFPALIATLSSITDGMQYGWSAPVMPVLRSNSSSIKITKMDEFWLETCYLLAGIAGLPLTVYLVGAIGRRNTIIVSSCIALVAWVVMAAAVKLEYLYFGRVIAGLAGDVSYVSAPLYLTEIAGKEIRGFLGGLDYLMMMVGILVIYTLVPYCPYYVHQIVGIALITVQLAILPFMPKSPYFLASQGQLREAKNALAKLRGNADVDGELKEIIRTVQQQNGNQHEKWAFFKLLKRNRRAIVIITGLTVYQQFSGFNVILMNLHTILGDANSIFLNPEQVGIMFAVFMVLSTAVCSSTVDKFGRKILLVTSAILTGLCLMAIAIYFTLQDHNVDLKNVSWLVGATVMFYAIGFKLGLGLLPQLLISELFAVNIKAKVFAYGEILYHVTGSLVLCLYHYLSYRFSDSVPFYVFTVLCFSCVLFTICLVPETKGKSLGEIQTILRTQNVTSVEVQR